MAQDKGYPPLSRSVEVRIEVVDRANNPPVWDHTLYGPIYVKENVAVGAKVVSVKARSVFPHFLEKNYYAVIFCITRRQFAKFSFFNIFSSVFDFFFIFCFVYC